MVLLGISADGANLLVADKPAALFAGPLWSVPTLGGSARRLGDTIGDDAAWSADGQTLVYRNNRELFVAKADGTQAKKLRTMPFDFGGPVWSPDGRVIRFSTANGIWEISTDGTNLHQVFAGWHHPADECCGQWTSDGKYFLFQSGDNIWAVSESTATLSSRIPVQLTFGPMRLSTPLPSKDGKRLYVLGGLQRGELTRYDRSTRQFVPFLSGISADELNFSRDGKWVAYVAYPEGTLWRSRADGTDRLQLTFPPLDAKSPTWSPDGKQIAFYAFSPNRSARIYLVSTDAGSQPEALLLANYEVRSPDWSPDGKKIVFGGDFGDPDTMIRIADLRSRAVVEVPGSKGLSHPRWSPDGKYLVALEAKLQGVALFDWASQKWTELFRQTAAFPIWSKDGQYVYLLHWLDKPSVMRVRIRDRKLELITDLSNFRQTGSDLIWLGLAPDDSPLLLHDVGSSEVFALDLELR
jgi:Tol biopolymer transport system component